MNIKISHKDIDPTSGVVIACTASPVKYQVPTIQLDFYHTNEGQPGFIEDRHMRALWLHLPMLEESSTIYVVCDLGWHRSPAVAIFLCELFGVKNKIRETYKFLNWDVYFWLKHHWPSNSFDAWSYDFRTEDADFVEAQQ